MQPIKLAAISMRWLAAIGLATLTTQPSAADVLYTYQTSPLNLLNGDGSDTGNNYQDSFTIAFLSPFVLAPNSYYNISVSNSASYISSWSASDSFFGTFITGSNAPISLAPAPGLMAGGTLTSCGTTLSCFGGAIATNGAGQIDQWNLVADSASAQPFVSFITYNNPFIETIDALDTAGVSLENRLGGPTGSWNGFTPPSFPGGVPEPSTWAMILLGFAGLGIAGYRTSRKSVA